MSKKKVLFLITALEVGGIETYLLRFLRYMNGQIEPLVLCKSAKAGTLKEEYEAANAEIILLKLSFFSIVDYVKLYKLLKEEQIDVVCDFTGDFAGLVLLTSKIAKIKNRIAFHRESKYQFKPTKIKLLYAKVMNALVQKNATAILSNSKTALDEFHPGWKEKGDLYEVIYNGIPFFPLINEQKKLKIRAELSIPKDAFLIGHVGRYTAAKNHEQIIKVAKTLLDKYSNVYFILCGRDVFESIEDQVNQHRLTDRIIMPGSRDDISEILQCMDAFYFPSLNEGQPNALLEAMSFGLPFVASNIGSIQESVLKEFAKYLLDPYDSNSSISLLSSFIEKKHFPSRKLAEWTKENYSAFKQFERFKKQLIGQ